MLIIEDHDHGSNRPPVAKRSWHRYREEESNPIVSSSRHACKDTHTQGTTCSAKLQVEEPSATVKKEKEDQDKEEEEEEEEEEEIPYEGRVGLTRRVIDALPTP